MSNHQTKMQPSKPSGSTATVAAASSKPSTTTLSPSTFPLNILVMILKRVPVKFILHMKCASKPWLSLLSSPEFVSLHLQETAKDPMNHCFLIHNVDVQNFHTMSLLNINSTDPEPFCFVNPFPLHWLDMDLVGSINGLVCLCVPPFGRSIALWNRAKWLYKFIQLSEKGIFGGGDVLERLSVGFAYDSVNDDYKVIRIAILLSNVSSLTHPNEATLVSYVPPGALHKTRAEVYSLKLDDWETIEVDSPFSVSSTRCNVIVKGIPYWVGKIYQGPNQSESTEVLLWFDVESMSFKHVPMPVIELGMGSGAKLVEWKGNLGMIVYSPRTQAGSYVHVLLFDDKETSWNKVSTYGPIPLKMDKVIQCSRDGVILGETHEGKLFLYDPETSGIKEYSVPRALKRSYKALSYYDSLVSYANFDSWHI